MTVTDNCWVVLAEYLFALGGSTPTSMQEKGVAVAAYTVAVLGILLSSSNGYFRKLTS